MKTMLQAVVSAIAVLIGPALLWFLYRAQRERHLHVNEDARALALSGKPYLICLWHGRLFATPALLYHGAGVYPPGSKQAKAIISLSRDGRLIAKVAKRFNIDVISGSSAEGGQSAVKTTMSALSNGEIVCVTPDGPRGPRYHASGTAVKMARELNIPILLVTWSSAWAVRFNSWDHAMLPLPFGKLHYLTAGPIWPDETYDNDQLSTDLNALTAEADKIAGREPMVMPTPEEIEKRRASLAKARKRKRQKAESA